MRSLLHDYKNHLCAISTVAASINKIMDETRKWTRPGTAELLKSSPPISDVMKITCMQAITSIECERSIWPARLALPRDMYTYTGDISRDVASDVVDCKQTIIVTNYA